MEIQTFNRLKYLRDELNRLSTEANAIVNERGPYLDIPAFLAVADAGDLSLMAATKLDRVIKTAFSRGSNRP